MAIEAFVFSLLSDAFFPIALTVAYAILVQPHLEPLLSQGLREQLARIDQILADHQRIYADMRRIDADHDRKRQEIRYQPFLLLASGLTAGAAIFAAGAAFMKLFGT